MTNKFVFTLSEHDSFEVVGAKKVNINDPSELRYTFWHPRNKRMQIYSTAQRFKTEAIDLLYIALMVFYVDRKVNRNAQNDTWTRDIEMYIPVKAYEKWQNIRETLTAALDFLTGDHWTIHFRERFTITEQESRYLHSREKYRRSIRWVDSDTFCMLSGGLDSFIGAINLIKEDKKPIFVGNYNGGKGVSIYQNQVVSALANQYGIDSNRFFRFYAAPVSGVEDSTRSRSLMFFAHAIAVASGMGHHVELYIPENGVISLNVPLTVMRIGSLSTRTTHPYFMSLLQKIVTDLGLDIAMVNPFQFETKGEMMLTCKDGDFLKDNFKKTMSCSHPDQGRWTGDKRPSHCGTCLPCTIRRAAIMAAGWTDDSKYRDPDYKNPEAMTFLKSYRMGLYEKKYSLAAIQMSGPITERYDDYAGLYERGIEELKAFVDSL